MTPDGSVPLATVAVPRSVDCETWVAFLLVAYASTSSAVRFEHVHCAGQTRVLYCRKHLVGRIKPAKEVGEYALFFCLPTSKRGERPHPKEKKARSDPGGRLVKYGRRLAMPELVGLLPSSPQRGWAAISYKPPAIGHQPLATGY